MNIDNALIIAFATLPFGVSNVSTLEIDSKLLEEASYALLHIMGVSENTTSENRLPQVLSIPTILTKELARRLPQRSEEEVGYVSDFIEAVVDGKEDVKVPTGTRPFVLLLLALLRLFPVCDAMASERFSGVGEDETANFFFKFEMALELVSAIKSGHWSIQWAVNHYSRLFELIMAPERHVDIEGIYFPGPGRLFAGEIDECSLKELKMILDFDPDQDCGVDTIVKKLSDNAEAVFQLTSKIATRYPLDAELGKRADYSVVRFTSASQLHMIQNTVADILAQAPQQAYGRKIFNGEG